MSEQLVHAHIDAQARLRALVGAGVARAWGALPGYDAKDVPQFLAVVVPFVTAGQRQSVALTEAFLARALGRQPLGVSPEELIGAAVRAGVPPGEVYHRPFVTVWTALKAGTEWQEAVNAGLARATATATTDVQLSMRGTLQAVGGSDTRILGYRRVPNAGACAFCSKVSGQRYTKSTLMPIHPGCGCGVDVVTAENRHRFTGKPENDLSVPGAAVREHGELGPVLTDPAHHFETL